MPFRKRKSWSLIVVLPLMSCTLLIDEDRDQCSSNDDCSQEITGMRGLSCVEGLCARSGLGLDPPWDCVGTERTIMAADAPFNARLVLRELGGVGGTEGPPLEGAEVRHCALLDPNCATLLSESVVSDENGVATVETTAGTRLNSYLEIRKDGFMPTIMVLSFGIDLETVEYEFPVFRFDEYNLLATLGGHTADPELAFVTVRHTVCDEVQGIDPDRVGIGFRLDTVDRSTAQFYLRGSPSFSSEETDDSGTGGFVNAPVGYLVIRGLFEAVEVSETSFITRAGWHTYTFPAPREIYIREGED